ncbi:MAG: hypothetical protein NZ750_10085 [Anaerolineae bacterium]|nr:hypothetical protein [Anaerolineae bacterium]MDW8172631.1 hypothetical protein [Anaerolineae bacterium]
MTDSSDGLTSFIVHPCYYEIVMHDDSRRAVDSWMRRIEAIWTLHIQTRQPIPVLTVHPHEGAVPLNYAFVEGLKLARRFRDLPPGRSAFLETRNFMTQMLDSFLRAMRLSAIEYYHASPHKRAEAVAWLSELGARLREDDSSG